jgi:hypothetical protein
MTLEQMNNLRRRVMIRGIIRLFRDGRHVRDVHIIIAADHDYRKRCLVCGFIPAWEELASIGRLVGCGKRIR